MILKKFIETLLTETADASLDKPDRLPFQAACAVMAGQINSGRRFNMSAEAAAVVMHLAARPSNVADARPSLAAPAPSCWFDMPPDSNGLKFGLLWIGDTTKDPLRQGMLFVVSEKSDDEGVSLSQLPLDITTTVEGTLPLADAVPGMAPDLAAHVRNQIPAPAAWLLGCFALLNQPEMIRLKTTSFAKLNKVRLKQKRFPLLGFDDVYLTSAATAVIESGSTRHFELLASGDIRAVESQTVGVC